MQVLILQFTDPAQSNPLPVFSQNLGVLASMLEAEGIECNMLTLGGFRPKFLQYAVIKHRPKYVLAELNPFSVAAAHRTIVELSERFALPVGVLGPYTTCRAKQASSIPGVRHVLIGEYEHAATALLRAINAGRDISNIPGLWINTTQGLEKGPPPRLVEDLDTLPHPNRELFDYQRIIDTTSEATFKVARGCDLWCGHCINDWYMDLYASNEKFLRRRSAANVLDEIEHVLAQYKGAQWVSFYDHAFASDDGWLGAFAAEYPSRCALPYRCFLPLRDVTQHRIDLLTKSRCREVHVHLGSGSRFIREEIFSMHLSEEKMAAACGMLRDAGIRIAAEVFVGCPYESEITIEETLELIRRCRVHEIHPRVYYPVPGTRAAEVCRENGWTSNRGEENYWRQRSVLNMPSMPAERINTLCDKLPRMIKGGLGGSIRQLLGKISTRRIKPPQPPRK